MYDLADMNKVVTAAITLALLSSSAAFAQQRKPNVVLILTDDQGTLDANCYGSTDLFTPAIDSLAADGVRFTQAYSHTVCCPTRAMLLTGRQPQRGNVNDWMQGPLKGPKGRNMLTSEVTLAEVLKQAGYRTGLFGKWHLGGHGDHGPTKQGFDEFFGIRDGFIENFTHYFLHREGYHDLYEGTREVFHRGEYFPDLMVDRALSFIERNQDDQFFVYIPFNIPHYPEQSLERHRDRYKSMAEPRRTYAATVTTTDDYIRRVLLQIDRLGLRENTIVIYQSDNGHSEEDYQVTVDGHLSGLPKGWNYGANKGGGNTGEWLGAKGSFLEGGIRVPSIVRYPPTVPKGETRSQIITAMDWFPTILEMVGVNPPAGVKLDGHSALPVIKNARASTAYGIMHWQWQKRWMVRDGDWKLMFDGARNLAGGDETKIYLSNLSDELPERTNHAKKQPEMVKRLTAAHEAWAKEVTPKNLPSGSSLP